MVLMKIEKNVIFAYFLSIKNPCFSCFSWRTFLYNFWFSIHLINRWNHYDIFHRLLDITKTKYLYINIFRFLKKRYNLSAWKYSQPFLLQALIYSPFLSTENFFSIYIYYSHWCWQILLIQITEQVQVQYATFILTLVADSRWNLCEVQCSVCNQCFAS